MAEKVIIYSKLNMGGEELLLNTAKMPSRYYFDEPQYLV